MTSNKHLELLKSSILRNEPSALGKDHKSILRCLLYFDLFDHPVSRKELEQTVENAEVFKELIQPLIDTNLVFEKLGHYSLRSSISFENNRKEEEQRAKEAMPKAISRGRFIYNFPFVKGVYISGSMSKGVLEEDGDVDYFLVTEPGKLWLCRSLLILFKKVFLFNSRKFFCLNYFIDSDHLVIEEQNIFTATELRTLVPLFHDGVHEKFQLENRWIREYHLFQGMNRSDQIASKTFFKSILEFVFSGYLGKALDRFFMKLTVKVWKRKFEDFEPPDFELALKSRTYVSKHHPQNFQKKVLTRFNNQLKSFELKHGIDLSW